MTAKFVGALFVLVFFGLSTSGLALDDPQTMLALINAKRANHCVPALAWSAEIAASAQTWADNCVFDHTGVTAENERGAGPYLGENLGGGNEEAAGAVDGWYAEKENYDFLAHGGKPGTVVGHFTQLIWRNTTQLGCGIQLCQGLIPGWGDTPAPFYVCRFSPGGNYQDVASQEQNVPPACK